MTGSLRFGALDLTDPTGNYSIEALGTDSGTTFGNPEAIVTELRSLLQYGSLVFHEGMENRGPVIAVAVRGADMAETAQAEAALVAELFKPNELVYTPDGWASGTVYDILFSELEPGWDDLTVALRSEVVYLIRLTAGPYVHSEAVTTTPALAASGTTTTDVDTMSATTGWTAAVNGAAVSPTSASGALSVTSAPLDGTVTVSLTRTGAITTSPTKYLVVDWKSGARASLAVGTAFSAVADGVTLTKVASAPSPTAGYTRTTFEVAAASVAAVTFTLVTDSPHPGMLPLIERSLTLDLLTRSDVRPTLGSAKQQIRTIKVGGSVPTIGSLSVEHETSALGDVIVYTYPDDDGQYAPPCRNYRVSGPTPVADAGAISGFVDVIDTETAYEVPVAATPRGAYLVMGRVGRNDGTTGTHSVTWTYAPRINGVVPPGSSVVTKTTEFTTTSNLDLVTLGMIDDLPATRMAEHGSAVTRFTVVSANPAGDNLNFDELLLFNLTIGRRTHGKFGTAAPSAGGASNRLWIESPSLANQGLGEYLRGFAANQADAFSAYPTLLTPGVHEFEPPGVKVYTLATNPTTPVNVAFAHRNAWLHHAAD